MTVGILGKEKVNIWNWLQYNEMFSNIIVNFSKKGRKIGKQKVRIEQGKIIKVINGINNKFKTGVKKLIWKKWLIKTGILTINAIKDVAINLVT